MSYEHIPKLQDWTCPKCGLQWQTRAEKPICTCEHAAPDILTEARNLISGPRREAYGDVTESFERVAIVWSALLKHEVTASDVALLMAAFKLCREANKASAENRVDAIGYMVLKDQLHKKGATQ